MQKVSPARLWCCLLHWTEPHEILVDRVYCNQSTTSSCVQYE